MGLEKLKSVFKEGFEEELSTTHLDDMVSEFGTPIGGLFNQSERYYGGFGVINTPKFTDIINSGNIVTNGGGYPNKQNILETFLGAQGIAPPTYIQNGIINTERTLVKDGIPQYNNLFTVTDGKVAIGAQNRDKTWESLYNADHTPKNDVGYSYLNVNRYN